MNEFLENSKAFIAVVSSSYFESKYCTLEFWAAFNKYIRTDNKYRFFSFRIANVKMPEITESVVYTDLFSANDDAVDKKVLQTVDKNTFLQKDSSVINGQIKVGLPKRISKLSTKKPLDKSVEEKLFITQNDNKVKINASEIPREYKVIEALIRAYRAASNEESDLSESYRNEVLRRFSKLASQFETAQPERLLQFCERGDMDRFLDLYSEVFEIAPDVEYFIMKFIVQNICEAGKLERLDLSIYFMQHGFEAEAKRMLE